MKKESPLREKSLHFGLKIAELFRLLRSTKTETALCNQLVRSGTAIGALIREAEYAQSKADFISKLSIALKEANETEYWIELLFNLGSIRNQERGILLFELREIIKMLIASIKTAKGM